MGGLIRSAQIGSSPRLLYGVAPVLAGVAPVPAREPDVAVPAAPLADAGLVSELEQQRARLEHQVAALNEECARMRAAQAEQTAQAREAATAQGYADGMARARAEADQQLRGVVQQVQALLRSVGDQQRRLAVEAEDLLVEIAFAALCRVLGKAAPTPEAVRAMVRHSTAELSERDEVQVRLHPDDARLLAEHAGSDPAGLRLLADAAVRLGGCMVDTPAGTLDARLETQLAELAQVLLVTRAERASQSGAPQ